MLALDLRQAITHALQEIGIGRDHRAVQVELDHCHGPTDGFEPAVGFAFALHARGDVHGVLDHFDQAAGVIAHWVVAGLQPHRLAVASHPFERAGLELAAAQVRPQLGVFGAAGKCGGEKHSMGLAHHLVGSVAQGFEKVVVGSQHLALRVELDHCHRAFHGVQQAVLLIEGVLQGVDRFLMSVEKHDGVLEQASV